MSTSWGIVISSEIQMNLGKKQTILKKKKVSYFLSNFIRDLTILVPSFVFQQWLSCSESHHGILSGACVHGWCVTSSVLDCGYPTPVDPINSYFRMLPPYNLYSSTPDRGCGPHPVPRQECQGPPNRALASRIQQVTGGCLLVMSPMENSWTVRF